MGHIVPLDEAKKAASSGNFKVITLIINYLCKNMSLGDLPEVRARGITACLSR